MGWRPRLNIMCGRCNTAHGPFDVCVSGSSRRRSLKPQLDFGKCPKCKKKYTAGGALTHHCAPKSDFGRRRKQAEKEARDKARKARPAHDYTECSDNQCKRPNCVAYKAGNELGDRQGHDRGWQEGYDRGFPEG